MRLFDLLDGDSSQLSNVAAIKDLEITGLTCDSRKVNPGFLFAAIPGLHSLSLIHISEPTRPY